MRRSKLSVFAIMVLLLGISACERGPGDDHSDDRGNEQSAANPSASSSLVGALPASFVGTAVCTTCHEPETGEWSGSHHDLAMQIASADTVLGDFGNAEFTYAGKVSRFSKRDGGYFALTEGPDGKPTEYQIRYAFGVTPLQQYLVEFSDGRIQALGIAWDTRSAEAGGQRWFHLYPDEQVDYLDELHWTKLSQNWNFMCADCHSTGYQKNYDEQNNSFASVWSDINVGCEACHGPGSEHVALAEAQTLENGSGLLVVPSNPGRHWLREPGEATARLSGHSRQEAQVEACGRCHARRASIRSEYAHGKPLADSFVPAMLTEPSYFPDGQIRDEVYVYGSFLQSKMYANGVICTDCHLPHSLALRAPGNALCAQCHAPEVFDVASHHHHPVSEDTPGCIDCHMPAKTYMVVDPRRDHSFRVPRPDLAESLEVTDACAACHDDREPGWSAAQVREWLGRDASGYQQYGQVFRAAHAGQADAAAGLKNLLETAQLPPIARATALEYLGAYVDPETLGLALQALDDEDPMVRLGALSALRSVPVETIQSSLIRVAGDPVLSVRTEAARQLATVDPASLPSVERERLRQALEEYVAIQKTNADRPESQTNLGNLYAQARQFEAAENRYRMALRLQPDFEPAYVNLVDMYRSSGNEAGAESLIEQGLAVVPQSAALNYAMGLLKVRTEGVGPAMPWLEKAVLLAPGDSRYQYVLAVAMHENGDTEAAIASLEEAHQSRPADLDIVFALVSFYAEAGNPQQAMKYAQLALEMQPGDPRARRLMDQLTGR